MQSFVTFMKTGSHQKPDTLEVSNEFRFKHHLIVSLLGGVNVLIFERQTKIPA